jgi:hypothetical protein
MVQVMNSSCPHFIHIPKNAGTAIVRAGFAEDVDLCSGDALVGDKNKNCGAFRHERMQQATKCFLPLPGGALCQHFHTPPAYWPSDAAQTTFSGSFCVSRDPYDRIVSEFKWQVVKNWNGLTEKDCDAESLNDFVLGMLSAYLDGSRYDLDCHLLPQSEHIWGPDGHKWCDEILRLEDLDTTFDDFMKSSGCPVHLVGHANESPHTCTVSSTDLNAISMALVEKVYSDDFEKLGYQMGSAPAVSEG